MKTMARVGKAWKEGQAFEISTFTLPRKRSNANPGSLQRWNLLWLTTSKAEKCEYLQES